MLNRAPTASRDVAVAFEVGRLEVSIPVGWRVQRGRVDGGPAEFLSGTEAATAAPVVLTVVASCSVDAQDRAANRAEFEAAVLEGLPRADVVDREITEVGGSTWFRLLLDHPVPGRGACASELWGARLRRVDWLLGFTVPALDYPHERPWFRAAVETARFTGDLR